MKRDAIECNGCFPGSVRNGLRKKGRIGSGLTEKARPRVIETNNWPERLRREHYNSVNWWGSSRFSEGQ